MFPTALTIAGSDCSGGAGIQADLKAFSANRVYGMSVLTSVVAENTFEVREVLDLSPHIIHEQLVAVCTDIMPQAVKIGMLANAEIMDTIVEAIQKYALPNIVLDPVMYAKNGFPLTNTHISEPLSKKLLPYCALVTPNIPEAEALAGMTITSEADIKTAAKKIYAFGCAGVLIKGGHTDSAVCTDTYYAGEDFAFFSAPRINTKNTHGTGCTLSSAIAANLAKEMDMSAAIGQAKTYLTAAIKHNPQLGKGNGPVNHFYEFTT